MEISDIKNEIQACFESNTDRSRRQMCEIIQQLPKEFQELLDQGFKHKRIPREYLLSSMLFAVSNAAGKAFSLKTLGYINYGNLYFAIIGNRGDVKSPAMDLATEPLNNYDMTKYEEYLFDKKAHENDKETHEGDTETPVRKQLFIQDSTIEATQLAHHNNPYSIGVFIDELYFLVEKMASKNSNEGAAWRTTLLQSSTNKHIDISRKTTKSFRIDKSYITLMGSIQTQFIPKLFANGNLESGLIDRILFTPKLTSNHKLSIYGISEDIKNMYAGSICNIMEYRCAIEDNEEFDSYSLRLPEQTEQRLLEYAQELIDRQESVCNFSQAYISKLLINIHKLLILTHLIQNAADSDFQTEISESSMDLAIALNEWYYTNFQIILEQGIQEEELPSIEAVIKFAMKNDATQKDVVNIAGVDKSTISRKWNRILNMQTATSNRPEFNG